MNWFLFLVLARSIPMGIALVCILPSPCRHQWGLWSAASRGTVGGWILIFFKGRTGAALEREMHAFAARSSVENLRIKSSQEQEPVAVRPTQKRTHTHLSAKPTNKRSNKPSGATRLEPLRHVLCAAAVAAASAGACSQRLSCSARRRRPSGYPLSVSFSLSSRHIGCLVRNFP